MKRRAACGFSLVELMIAMAIGVTLVLGVTQIFLAGRQSFVVQQKTAVLQENARFALSRISRDLRQAGMFGCIDLARLPAATRDQLPSAFDVPVSFADDVLRLMTAVPVRIAADLSGNHSAASYGAQWLLVSDCLNELRVAAGPDALEVQPGDVVIPVRQIEYRVDRHRLQTRLNGRGNFEVLIDGVANFELSFGLAAAAAEGSVQGDYLPAVAPEQLSRVRSVRMALTLSDNPAQPQASKVKAQEYTLVTALRNRLY